VENLISKEYKEKIVALHNKKNWGNAIDKTTPYLVNKYMHLSNANSILDYGAGYGEFKKQMNIKYPKLNIHEYEPGVIGKDEDPPACDATVCFDVLEHVEPNKIGGVLQHIYNKTNKWAYVVICTVPARKTFPDGQNVHLLVRESNWWLNQLKYDWNMFDIVKTSGHLKVLLIKK